MFELLRLVLSIVLRIRVKLIEHIEQRVVDIFLRTQCVHIISVQFLIKGIEDVEILRNLKIMVGIALRRAFNREDKGKKKKQLFHVENVDKKKEQKRKRRKGGKECKDSFPQESRKQ